MIQLNCKDEQMNCLTFYINFHTFSKLISYYLIIRAAIFGGSSQCTNSEHPVSFLEPRLVIHFTYDNLHVSMPFSQIILPLFSTTESKRLFTTSVSLFLSHIQGYRYHLSKFHRYVLVYCIGVFLSGLLHSV